MKKVIQGVVVVLLVILTVFSTLQISGMNKNDDAINNSTTIAIVNLDKGIKNNDGSSYNYGTTYVDRFEGSIEVVSNSAAVEGLKSNEYAGIITIPESFSENIYSFNDSNNEKAKVRYQLDKELNENKIKDVNNTINLFMSEITYDTSYIFINAMLEEINNTQNKTNTIINNDKKIIESVSENPLKKEEEKKIPENNIETPNVEQNEPEKYGELIKGINEGHKSLNKNQEDIKDLVKVLDDEAKVLIEDYNKVAKEYNILAEKLTKTITSHNTVVQALRDYISLQEVEELCYVAATVRKYEDVEVEVGVKIDEKLMQDHLKEVRDVMESKSNEPAIEECEVYQEQKQKTDEFKTFPSITSGPIELKKEKDQRKDTEIKTESVEEINDNFQNLLNSIELNEGNKDLYVQEFEEEYKKYINEYEISANEVVDVVMENYNSQMVFNDTQNSGKITTITSFVNENVAALGLINSALPNSKINGAVNTNYVDFSISPFVFEDISEEPIVNEQKVEKNHILIISILGIGLLVLIIALVIISKKEVNNE